MTAPKLARMAARERKIAAIKKADHATNIVWICEGFESEPFMMIRHCTEDIGCVNYIPRRIDYKRLTDLKAAGFVIDDPDNLITCHCGEFKSWRYNECDACRREALDAADDRQMYDDLRYGG